MATPLFLYSTNSYLAYHINEDYYNGKHYVWCSRYFNGRTTPSFVYTNPPSSCPENIYRSFLYEIEKGEFHSYQIKNNAVGLRKGVISKFKQNVINTKSRKEILSKIQVAQEKDRSLFYPLIYVISFAAVVKKAKPVPIAQKANPLSDEYILTDLTSKDFDIIDLRGVFNV